MTNDEPIVGRPIVGGCGAPVVGRRSTGAATSLPDGAYALALSSLPGVGPVSLQRLLGAGDPGRAWADVIAGRARRPVGRAAAGRADGHHRDRVEWDVAARQIDVAALWAQTRSAGIGVTWWGHADYPVALRTDPLPPAVLFWRGSLEGLDGPCVALVGTRHATPEGRALAFEMGRDLAAAGVCIVSGLALGIDGASHRGALSMGRAGATVGVAASGVDCVYPTRHRELWEEVVRVGAVVSETPPGRPAQTWRFPARNRIIAGLVSVVVIVESHAAGGSLITAEAAIERGIEVRAVPGPVRSPASAGTNQLLYDGPGPVRDATDVLIALGTAVSAVPISRGSSGGLPEASSRSAASPSDRGSAAGRSASTGSAAVRPARSSGRFEGRPVPGGAASAVLEAMGWQPRSLNWIVARSGGDVGAVAEALTELGAAGRVSEERGWWQRLG